VKPKSSWQVAPAASVAGQPLWMTLKALLLNLGAPMLALPAVVLRTSTGALAAVCPGSVSGHCSGCAETVVFGSFTRISPKDAGV
jgi:hypothetical protein